MSRLIILTRPELAPGFQLAGIESYFAKDVETAQELIETWIAADEEGLLAIDDGLLEKMDPAFIKRMESTGKIPFLAIPGGEPLGPESSRKHRIAEMIRRAIGFHITFKGEEEIEKP
jgi:vacuolar-type H+-ATPase subunit F/Vma7